MTTRLYMCVGSDGSGETLDSLVEAETPEQAFSLWQQAIADVSDGLRGFWYVLVVPEPDGRPRPIGWHNDLPCALEGEAT